MANASLLIRRSIKSAASLTRSGIGYPRAATDAVNILAYHRVVADIERAEREAYYGIVVSSDTFRRHCEMLSRTYNVVSLERAADYLAGNFQTTRPLAVITFDDGYLDFFEEAYPILTELRLPATMFLPVDLIGQERPLAHDRIFWLLRSVLMRPGRLAPAMVRAGVAESVVDEFAKSHDHLKLAEAFVFLPAVTRERLIIELEAEVGGAIGYPREYGLLNWDQVGEMAANGISFGGHTASHVVLTLEDEASLAAEIIASKNKLEKHLGAKVTAFAYPNGAYNENIRSVVGRAGYSIAVTTEKRLNRPGADLLALGRTSLCEESTRGIGGYYSQGVAGLRLGV